MVPEYRLFGRSQFQKVMAKKGGRRHCPNCMKMKVAAGIPSPVEVPLS